MKVVITNNTNVKLRGLDLDYLIEEYSKCPRKTWYNASTYSISLNDVKLASISGYSTATSVVININPISTN